MDKPLDWDPIDEGKQVTLDHDYRRPGTERKANPKEVPDIGRRGQGKGGLFRTMELRPEDLENALIANAVYGGATSANIQRC